MTKFAPFTLHRNTRFERLIRDLEQAQVISLQAHGDARQVVISDFEAFQEILRYVFILYATPSKERQITVWGNCQPRRLAMRGLRLNLALTECVSDKTDRILGSFAVGEDEKAYEESFNALIAVYLGSLKPLKCIYPNSCIVELGRGSHEMDVVLLDEEQKCVVVETTLGFDKELDGVDESYSWHFKKAMFRKWLVERVFGVDCKLCYLTLQNLAVQRTVPQDPPKELSKEFQGAGDGAALLIDRIRESEGEDRLKIIEFGIDSAAALTLAEIDIMLQSSLLNQLKAFL